MTIKIRALDADIRAPPGAGDPGALARDVEHRLIRRALEICDHVVHRALGEDVVLRVRTLDVSFRARLDGELEAERLGRDLADALIPQARASRACLDRVTRRPASFGLGSPSDRGVLMFESEAELFALELALAVAGGGTPWYVRTSGGPHEVWQAAMARGGRVLGRTLDHLVAMDLLPDVVRAVRPDAVSAAVAMLAGMYPRDRGVEALLTLYDAHEDQDSPPRVEARPSRDGAPSSVTDGSAARSNADADHVERVRDEPQPGPADPVSSAPSASTEAERGTPDGSATSVAPTDRSAALEPEERPPSLEPRTSQDRAEPSQPSGAGPLKGRRSNRRPPKAQEAFTARAGLFFLVRSILRLEIAEHLWCAGLDEPRVLFDLANLVTGLPDDPAVLIFSGLPRPPDTPRPPVPAWAVTEVIEKSSSVLMASGGAPSDQIRGLVGEWSMRAPADSLVAHLAAILSVDAALQLGRAAAVSIMDALVQFEGRVRMEPERVVVSLPMSAVRIDLRRAGLDQNPGWVPWLKKRVEIEFGDGADEIG